MSCPDCFKGHVHEGEPKGKEDMVHGRDCYVSEPPQNAPPKGIIIIVPDAFGWKLPNTRLLADTYACRGGYLVYLPDFMNGRAAPTSIMNYTAQIFPKTPTFWTYLWRPYYLALSLPGMIPFVLVNSFSAAYPRINKFFSDVRNAEGAELPIGASGFCWGGRMVVVLAADAERKTAPVLETPTQSEVHVVRSLVDAVFTGHPSMMKIPRELEKVVKPLSIAVGDKDAFLPPAEVAKVKKALEKRNVDAGVKSEVLVYEGAGHGFAIRFDPGNENLAKQSRETEDQALAWFEECFKAL